MKGLAPTTMQEALLLTESNLTSLINAKHSDAVLMTAWREVVRDALNVHTKAADAVHDGSTCTSTQVSA